MDIMSVHLGYVRHKHIADVVLQVPYILLGEAVCVVGTPMLTRLEPDTSTVKWAAYLVVTGIGMGMAMQLPYTAIQVVLQ